MLCETKTVWLLFCSRGLGCDLHRFVGHTFMYLVLLSVFNVLLTAGLTVLMVDCLFGAWWLSC